MSSPSAPGSSGLVRDPRWMYLFSHHEPGEWGRTLVVRWRGHYLRLCTRCTGAVIGLLGGPIALTIFNANGVDVVALPVQIAFGALPLFAAVDWLSQTVWQRESNSARRLPSGFFLGVSISDLAFLGRHGSTFLVVGAAILLILYVGGISTALLLFKANRIGIPSPSNPPTSANGFLRG